MRNAILCVVALFAITMQSCGAFAQAKTFWDHVDAAGRYIDRAKELVNDGKYHDACRFYRFAQEEYADAIWQADNVKNSGASNDISESSKLISSIQRDVCNKEDTAGTWPPPAPEAPSSTDTTPIISQPSQPVWADMSIQVAALQSTIDTAYGYAGASSRLYAAHDFAGSCIKARASAHGYGKARAEAAAILKASASFHDIGLRDVQALDTNVAQSGRDADDYYCKPPRTAMSFQTEINGFAAMTKALHLERGTVTPMTSAQAISTRSTCITYELFAATKGGSVFARALNDGCQSFTFMYNMQLPGRACTSLSQAKNNLLGVEPEYAAQGKKLSADLGVLQAAFKCNDASVGRPGDVPSIAERTYERGALSNIKATKSDLPPMKLDIKPLPAHAS